MTLSFPTIASIPLTGSRATLPRGLSLAALMLCPVPALANAPYPVPDTLQTVCFGATAVIDCPAEGQQFAGQDAQVVGVQPSYADNGDGTVSDLVTGLMWARTPDLNGDGAINISDKLSFEEAIAQAESMTLGGYDDWRLPTITELYSLMDFRGQDPSGYEGSDTSGLIPFIDRAWFDFGWGDVAAGERIIDAQMATSTQYVSTTGPRKAATMFGVNFADGRIKGYSLSMRGQDNQFYVFFVRGDVGYGVNDFADNGDGTVSDAATGLMWAKADSGQGMDWADALAWAEAKNAEGYLGHDDWRLPNVKELQGLVDYTRSPDTTGSAAINPVFQTSEITNELGQTDWPYFWSSTTHANWTRNPGSAAAYVSFGRAIGNVDRQWTDIHGAGAQRSDPKAGDPSAFPNGRGPQGDAIRILNFVRLVRDADVTQ
ncbi:DUF1566 domain-containing protein [Phaeovulum sp.]|uniref:Lcl C-terminal domain-containing protein n=1 Tax=Phaeovulum sp. TaxID=2934796 RepID=UPI003565A904